LRLGGCVVAGHKKAGREGSLDFLASFDNLDQKSTPLIDQRKGVLWLYSGYETVTLW
jgi:hypothetical protein